ITTTANHGFEDQTTPAWTEAAELQPGQSLSTPGGGSAVVRYVRPYLAAYRTYNLTIDGVHTYFVEAGTTPVLVHNDCPTRYGRGRAPEDHAGTLAEDVAIDMAITWLRSDGSARYPEQGKNSGRYLSSRG